MNPETLHKNFSRGLPAHVSEPFVAWGPLAPWPGLGCRFRPGTNRSFLAWWPVTALVAAALFAGAVPAAVADSLIDSFDGRISIAPWTFYNGAEFPGATGSLSLAAGYSGQGAHLAFNFAQGGAYVEASLNLPTPLSAAAISFWVRSPPDIYVTLRVVDSTGQTLQYTLNRPAAAAADPTGWYLQVVALNEPTLWYSGANDGVLHNQITAIGIIAGNQQISGLADSIDFDQVTAVSSTAVTLHPSVTPAAAAVPSANLLDGLGVNIHFTKDDQALDAAAGAGFSWVRMDLTWSEIEQTHGVYDWSSYDGLITSLASRGMHALFILDYGNSLYTGAFGGPPVSAAAVTAFANFAAAAALHFAGTGTRFEVWNEPNLHQFWSPAADPTQYAVLAAAAIAGVHRGDATALVSTGGLSGFDYAFATGYLSVGVGVGASAIGIHPYDVTNPAGELVDNLVLLRSLVAQSLPNPPPVWETEWGFSSVNFSPAGAVNGHDPTARREQAQYATEEILADYAVGFPLYVYYDIRDDGTDATIQEDNFGLLANDYSVKPAYTAISTLASAVRGRTFRGFLTTGPTSMVAMQFDGPANQVVVLWSDVARSSVVITPPVGSNVVDFLGNAVALTHGAFTLSGATGPVYVTTEEQAHLSNLSVRSISTPDTGQLIAGFTISGGSKSVLVRGIGPALTGFGVTTALPGVQLTLFNSAASALATDTGWGGTAALAAAFAQVGAFSLPSTSLDSALLMTLAPGAYTDSVLGTHGSSGVGLAEIYDADLRLTVSRLTNGSARAFVGTGANILIAGFTIGGTGSDQLLVRAIGPSLAQFGVDGVLAKPSLAIYDSKQNLLYQNSVWGGSASLAAAFAAVGAFPIDSDSTDSALLVTLEAGSYTAQVSGVDGGTGIGLVEVYEVPQGP